MMSGKNLARSSVLRRRFFLAMSGAYIVLGLIILGRSIAAASLLPLGLLGAVLIALGLVRLRDYANWKRSTSAN